MPNKLTQETQDKLKSLAVSAFEKFSTEGFAGSFQQEYADLSAEEAAFLKTALKDVLKQEEAKVDQLQTVFNTASNLINNDPAPTCAASTAVTLAEVRLNKAKERVITFKANFS